MDVLLQLLAVFTFKRHEKALVCHHSNLHANFVMTVDTTNIWWTQESNHWQIGIIMTASGRFCHNSFNWFLKHVNFPRASLPCIRQTSTKLSIEWIEKKIYNWLINSLVDNPTSVPLRYNIASEICLVIDLSVWTGVDSDPNSVAVLLTRCL